MDLKLIVVTGAVNLIGIAIVLRQIYKTPTPEPIRIATREVERRRRLAAARREIDDRL